jgi:hypothetical protein
MHPVVGVACIVRVHPVGWWPLRTVAVVSDADGDDPCQDDGDGSTTARRERNGS